MIRFFELRMEKGLSQRDMAKICNISQATYNNWENGKTPVGVEDLLFYCQIADVPLENILIFKED